MEDGLRLEMDRMFFRKLELQECKSQKEKDILLDRWQREDSAREIADAIRSTARAHIGFLWF